MKKTIILISAIAFMFIAGCSTMPAKIKEPRGYPYKAPKVIQSQSTADSNQQVLDAINTMGDKIVMAINGGQQKPAQAQSSKKSLPKNFFEDEKEKPAKKKVIRTYSRHENRKLKDRVANLEEIVYHNHPGNKIVSVLYRSGSGLLSSKEKINIKKLYEENWLTGKCNFEALRSYASKTKPKPPLTNMDVSQLRLQELINFLKELGFPKPELDKMVIQNCGPTDRWNNNLRVTIKVQWNSEQTEIDKLKKEREQYAPPSKNNQP